MINISEKIIELVGDIKTVIYAGNNCKFNAINYSKLVDTVHLFDPTLSRKDYFGKNIFLYPIELGNVEITIEDNIVKIPLDLIRIWPSLIHLDIKDYKNIALGGMRKIIEEHNPIIVIHNNTNEDMLLENGYEKISTIDSYSVYKNWRIHDDEG